MKAHLLTIASVLAVVASTAGCTVETSPAPEPTPVVETNEPDGTLTLDWSIDGTKDPDRCDQAVAVDIIITVTTSDGADAGTFRQDCTAFATTISLAPGRYVADAQLVDGAGNARTTNVPVNPFTIDADGDLDIPIDFPADSFF